MTDLNQKTRDPGLEVRLKSEVESARRFSKEKFGAYSTELSPQWLDEQILGHSGIEKLLSDITSLRSRHKVLRVARSIQALERSESLREEHVFEAKWYRF